MAERIRTDETIAKDVVDSLSWDSRVYASNVSVRVDRGIVTLTGTVPTYSSRVAASEDVWLITGVRAVENQLKVVFQVEDMALRMRGVVGVTNKIVVVLTDLIADEILAEAIINALDRNVNVDVDDIDVTVENGTVFLNGAVPSGSAKRAAYDTARYRSGVKEEIVLPTELNERERNKLFLIAKQCSIHRMIEDGIHIDSRLVEPETTQK